MPAGQVVISGNYAASMALILRTLAQPGHMWMEIRDIRSFGRWLARRGQYRSGTD